MKLLKSVLVASMIMGSASASADIASDVQSQLPMNQIFNNALSTSTSIADIFNQIGTADQTQMPAATTYATCNSLDSTETILSAAFSAAPGQAQAISNAARACGATEEQLLNSALASNIDPTTIGEATAAGGLPAAGGGIGGTGTTVAAPSFGSAGGTGGGGTASAG
ncbi:MAG: hypothetical protein HRU04_23875 [Oceanospirillaceae bacterium]|nr:hypothetical protein [Oceanospirillaceae bacterium]